MGSDEGPRSKVLYAVVAVFGLSSWIVINGIFAELPLFIQKLPEGPSIVILMSVMVQCSNVVPLIYYLAASKIRQTNRFAMDTTAAFALISLGAATCVLLAIFWRESSVVAGESRSVAFLVLMFFAGVGDCTTSVVYWPIIARYQPQYSSALMVGEGATGAIAGILALVQQPGVLDRFSFAVFCAFLVAVLIASGVALGVMRWHPLGKRSLLPAMEVDSVSAPLIDSEQQVAADVETSPPRCSCMTPLVFWQGVISFSENGLITLIVPYLLLGYPHGDVLLVWAVTLALILDPIFAFIAQVVRRFTPWLHTGWIVLSAVCFGIGVAGSHRPYPDCYAMGIVLVVIRTVERCFWSYCKTSEFIRAHEEAAAPASGRPRRYGPSAFRHAGVAMQVGGTAGTVIMLLLMHFNALTV